MAFAGNSSQRSRSQTVIGSLFTHDLGYCFDSLEEILPYLEVAETGSSFVWASKTGGLTNKFPPSKRMTPESGTLLASSTSQLLRPHRVPSNLFSRRLTGNLL